LQQQLLRILSGTSRATRASCCSSAAWTPSSASRLPVEPVAALSEARLRHDAFQPAHDA
jgi:hypothetical protein